jgi:ribonuclease BN (tRNA processing enzyme)
MRLVILGSGTSVPHPKRAAAAFWVETDSGSLLLDISGDAAHRMAQELLDWQNLAAIWISHFHLDHMGGLAPFLFATKHSQETQTRTRPLVICGPPGLKRLLTAVDESYNYGLLQQAFPVNVIEIEPPNPAELLPGLEVTTFSTPHTVESSAIRLKDKSGSSLVYTSDTGYATDLIEFAAGASLLLMESSFLKNKPIEKHLELKEALNIAAGARPRKLVLAHLYPQWDGIDLASEASKLWSGETIEAYDGLRIEF